MHSGAMRTHDHNSSTRPPESLMTSPGAVARKASKAMSISDKVRRRIKKIAVHEPIKLSSKDLETKPSDATLAVMSATGHTREGLGRRRPESPDNFAPQKEESLESVTPSWGWLQAWHGRRPRAHRQACELQVSRLSRPCLHRSLAHIFHGEQQGRRQRCPPRGAL